VVATGSGTRQAKSQPVPHSGKNQLWRDDLKRLRANTEQPAIKSTQIASICGTIRAIDRWSCRRHGFVSFWLRV
jgi:hypothetical protein